MKENFAIAIDFLTKVKKIKDFKHVIQMVLFGSVAKGEDNTNSDIDIAIIHDLTDIEELKSEINKFLDERIQVVYMDRARLAGETELVAALTGEGILLYGKPINVSFESKALQSFILLVYDTSELDKKKRMLLNRALHGSVSKSKYKGKVYSSSTKGIVAQPGITKLAKACLLIDPKKAVIIRELLKRFDVKYKEELIWK